MTPTLSTFRGGKDHFEWKASKGYVYSGYTKHPFFEGGLSEWGPPAPFNEPSCGVRRRRAPSPAAAPSSAAELGWPMGITVIIRSGIYKYVITFPAPGCSQGNALSRSAVLRARETIARAVWKLHKLWPCRNVIKENWYSINPQTKL